MRTNPAAISLFLLLGLCATSTAEGKRKPIPRGYLDKAYRLDSLNGRDIHYHGLSKANAKLERTLETAQDNGKPMVMDSLYRAFNDRVMVSLRKRLVKSQVFRFDSATGPGGIAVNRLIGDPVMPDSFAVRIPDMTSAGSTGKGPGISLVVGKVVFGVRSQLVERILPQPQDPLNPHFPHRVNPPLPSFPKFKRRYYAEPPDDPLENQDESHYNPYIVRDKKRKFYTVVEFCFYDHRAKRAFGYGWDGEETDFRGDFAQAFFGNKLDLESHMRDQAESLVEILVRKGGRLEHYRDSEIVLVAGKPAPVERIKEEMEEEEDE